MFCYQCQETVGNAGCKVKGVCGKSAETARLQDALVYLTKANFDNDRFVTLVKEAFQARDRLMVNADLVARARNLGQDVIKSLEWRVPALTAEAISEAAENVGVLSCTNEDVRSLRELITVNTQQCLASRMRLSTVPSSNVWPQLSRIWMPEN
jgi:hydroxylamine reductase